MTDPVLLWLRRDLRLPIRPRWSPRLREGPVIPVYVLDDETPKHRAMGGASRWWLHHSLAALERGLREKGSRLILRRGKCDEVLADARRGNRRDARPCLRHYEPWWRNAERAVAKRLDLVCHDGNYLAPPGSVTTGGGHALQDLHAVLAGAERADAAARAARPAPQRSRRPTHGRRATRWTTGGCCRPSPIGRRASRGLDAGRGRARATRLDAFRRSGRAL